MRKASPVTFQTNRKTFLLWSERVNVPEGVTPIRVMSKTNRRCTIIGNDLYSYDTKVATIDWNAKILFIPKRSFSYSLTTSRQLHEVACKFELTTFANRPEEKIRKCDMTHGYSR